jgi:hypothetical protein
MANCKRPCICRILASFSLSDLRFANRKPLYFPKMGQEQLFFRHMPNGMIYAERGIGHRVRLERRKMHSDLIVFGENWGWQPTGTHHLVRHLGAGRKVVWVNSPIVRCCPTCPFFRGHTPEAGGYRPDRILAPLAGHLATGTAARAANQQLLGHQIRTAMAALEVRRPILLTSVPTAIDAVGEIGEHAVVYYCDTNFGHLPGIGHCPTAAMEAELAGRADLIIAASPALASRFPSLRTVVMDQDESADRGWDARAATVERLLARLA